MNTRGDTVKQHSQAPEVVAPALNVLSRRRDGMRLIPAGSFQMGSDHHYIEEAPVRRVSVDAFWIDETPVTNAQYAAFVAATGYLTVAERAPDPRFYSEPSGGVRPTGSIVFVPPDVPTLEGGITWWSYREGACWHRPSGRGSSVTALSEHPVVHVAYCDALAYARWAGKALPREAQWEYAARGGLDGCVYAWGNDLTPNGMIMANYWQGIFPWNKRVLDGNERTSSVRSFPANGYGLYDMIGNVWEWTSDWFVVNGPRSSCCGTPSEPEQEKASRDPSTPHLPIGRKVLKGGSHLCAPNYCRRYRPAARYPQPVDTATSHVGFRCVATIDGRDPWA